MNLDRDYPPQTCAIGLDVGGTKIAGGLVGFPGRTEFGNVLARNVIATRPERGGESVLADALKLARQLMQDAKTHNLMVAGIGIAVCELVDLTGSVISAHTVAWRGLPIQEAFSELAPAVVDSDSRTPALAEAHLGAGKPFNTFVYITVGTGISYCLVLDRKPYTGAHGNALILASSPLTTTCTNCGTVLKPVLEEFASGPALVSRYKQILTEQTTSHMQAITRAEEVFAALDDGDMGSFAREVVESAGHALGVSVGWLVNTLDPEAIIVGGGLGMADGLYWDSFIASTRQHIWSDMNRGIPILHAQLGVDAGFIGAATTALKKFYTN